MSRGLVLLFLLVFLMLCIALGLFTGGMHLPPREVVSALLHPCLLYPSDDADDLLCVDLGGCRILKKKTLS